MRMCEREIKTAMVSWKMESGLEVREGPEVLRNIWDGRNPPENPEKKESTSRVGC